MSKTPSAIRLYQGLSIYRVENSTKWYVRVWDRKRKKYIVKSTGEESAIKAKALAQELGGNGYVNAVNTFLGEAAGSLVSVGTGGTVKEGVIEVQGDHRELVMRLLTSQGFTVKAAGG